MPKAIVLGGGIGGLASAIGLAQAGWEVAVYERAGAIEPLGAALSVWPNATAALDRLGLLGPVRAAAAPLASLLIADRKGRPIIGPRPCDGLALMITRAALHRCLADALPSHASCRLGQAAYRVEQDALRATVHFSNGQIDSADLVIDAGGIRSVAGQAWGSAASAYAGYGGIVALSDPVDGPGLDGLAAEYWGQHERFGVFELQDRQRYWFYMQSRPQGVDAPDHAMLMARAGHFPDPVAATVAATAPSRLIPFAIHARPAPEMLGCGRIIAVGDAAHAMEPNLGQGACQALEDAVALGAVARRVPPDQVLDAFERLRLERTRFIVRRAAEGRLGAHGSRLVQAAIRAMLRAGPDIITTRMMQAAHNMPDYG